MESPPFQYPDEDEVPYKQWFRDSFESVFVALNPFVKLSGHPPYRNGDWLPDSVVKAAKLHGSTCGVSWMEIARLCNLPSVRHVNRALGLTGSKRLAEKFSCPEDTKTLLRVCSSHSIYPPDEGCPSPLLELSMGSFVQDLGHETLVSAGLFGSPQSTLSANDLINNEKECEWAELWTLDRSLYCTIYTDYHHFLICQTQKSLQMAQPDNYFEGFFADPKTNDLWGVGNLTEHL